MQIPNIILENKYFIGDTVLLEPVARQLQNIIGSNVVISSKYPELLENHPDIYGIHLEDRYPDGYRTIDLSQSICSYVVENGKYKLNPDKIQNMYKEAGIYNADHLPPKLYLSESELEISGRLLRCFPPYKNIGIALESRNTVKSFPYIKTLVQELAKRDSNIFLFSKELKEKYRWVLNTPNVHLIFGLSLREVMQWISIMDVMIGPDTGLMHMAGALSIPLIVTLVPFWKGLYDVYDNCNVITSKNNNQNALKSISSSSIIKINDTLLPNKDERLLNIRNTFRVESRKHKLALFRLDGFGGSITLGDHAKKIYDQFGIKSSVIIRNNKEIFDNNPYVDEVILVGHVNWHDCLHQMAQEYGIIGEIRFAPCKWHQLQFKLFEQDFSSLDAIFERFPINYKEFEIHGIHHIQVTDKIMGLPYDTIDSNVYSYKEPNITLPKDYIIVNNGVDALYKGIKQTKSWIWWNELTANMDLPFVQVGTEFDGAIKGSLDLRGKLSIPELFWVLQNSKCVVACEGGIMHASYASNAKNVIILRGPTTGKLFEYPDHQFVDSYICDRCWSITPDWYIKCPKDINSVCMESITWQRVAFNIERVLNENMV